MKSTNGRRPGKLCSHVTINLIKVFVTGGAIWVVFSIHNLSVHVRTIIDTDTFYD